LSVLGSLTERRENLRADILNSPAHVFGDHRKCANYFCGKEDIPEEYTLPRLEKVGFWADIMKIVNNFEFRESRWQPAFERNHQWSGECQ